MLGTEAVALRQLPDDDVFIDRVRGAASGAHQNALALERGHRSAMSLSAFGTHEDELLSAQRHRLAPLSRGDNGSEMLGIMRQQILSPLRRAR